MSRNDLLEITVYKRAKKCSKNGCKHRTNTGIRYFPCADESSSMDEVLKTKPTPLCTTHLSEYLNDEDNYWIEYHRVVIGE